MKAVMLCDSNKALIATIRLLFLNGQNLMFSISAESATIDP
jgi:hypothetical protein